MNEETSAIAERPPAQSESMLPIIQQAMTNGVDPAKLEKMLDLHERWMTARAAEAYGSAISAFQSEMPVVEKKRSVMVRGELRSKFANYEDIMKIARPLLARHGIGTAYDTRDVTVDGVRFIEVTITIQVGSYSKDKRFMCPIPMELNASQPQKWGAALMFARRYSFTAAFDIVTADEDDDAESVVSTITVPQFRELENLIAKSGANLLRFLAWIGAPSLDMLRSDKFNEAKAELLRKVAQVKTKRPQGDPEP